MTINLTPNVYAHWKLNETSGNTVSDSSVNGRDGLRYNMEDADWVAGKLNNCLLFDGTNEYVNCNDIASFEKNQAFSLELWIKKSPSTSVWLSKWGNPGGNRGWEILEYANDIYLILSSTYGINYFLTRIPASGLNNNSWHHLVITYDGSVTHDGVTFYADNVVIPHNQEINNLIGSIIGDGKCQISGRVGANFTVAGSIDEVVIYDKELTPEEVAFRWNDDIGTESMEETPITPIHETILCNWDKTTSVDSRTIRRVGVWTQIVTAIKNAFNNFTTSGFLFLHNDNTEWEDFRVAVNNIKVPATKNPDWVSYKGGLILSFENQEIGENEEEVYFLIQLPHSIKEGSTIKPHIHWIAKSNEESKVVRWGISYSFANIDAVFPNETIIYVNAATNNAANKHVCAYFPDIPLPDMLISGILIIKLFRNSSSGSDTYTDEAYLLEFDLHIEKNTIGSREVLIK